MNSSLPIWQIQSAILEHFTSSPAIALIAPTGSGKSTQVPQMLLDGGVAGTRQIVVLQPRRVAARTVAQRVAQERNVRIGTEVGFQVRYEDETSPDTKICFVTEGILLRWLQSDPQLSWIGTVIFDEFHERNLLSDIALGLAKRLQKSTRPDLKIIVMSATLEAEPVSKYLDGCPILVSEGKMFPVEVRFQKQPDERPITDQAADELQILLADGETGDVLIFMPGMWEINTTISAIRANRYAETLDLIPLHGELPPDEQDRAFAPSSHRKIIVSTNVAETSVTIDGIRHVIDSGMARVARFDSERGIQTLFLEEISRSSAEQRKGRAGRTAPGTCTRLWTESGHLNRPAKNTPEIQRTDLAEAVLLLHSLGIRDATKFDWLDKPDTEAVRSAEALLNLLGALDEKSGGLTNTGRAMMRLPMHPRFSRMLVEAIKRGCAEQAALCAALVSGRNLMVRLTRDEKHISEARELFEASQISDFYTLMRGYQFAKNNHFSVEHCRRYGIHGATAKQVEQTFDQIRNLLEKSGLLKSAPEQNPKKDSLPICIMAGFIDQLCHRDNSGTLECSLIGNRHGTLMRESVVQAAPLFVAANIREVADRFDGKLTLLGLATATTSAEIAEVYPGLVTRESTALYDRTHKRVAGVELLKVMDLVIDKKYLEKTDDVASGNTLAAAYLQQYFELPLLNHEVKQLMMRCRIANHLMPGFGFPDFNTERLGMVLGKAFHGLTLAKEAQAVHLVDHFKKELGRDALEMLEVLLPTKMEWLDGKTAKLAYPPVVDLEDEHINPELQVKLQDCFKLTSHPTVCEGKLPIRLWLCTSDGKRLEDTTDWPKFRTTVYPKHKAMLQKKFPGFAWP